MINSQNRNKSHRTISSSNASTQNPFVWGNIALVAAVPWLLIESMAGLAVGDPVFPAWFEIFLLGLPAIGIVAWQQWQQPIYPFSLWFVVKPQSHLCDRELRMLALVKQPSNGWYVTGWMAVSVAILMLFLFSKIYSAAPLAEAIAPFPSGLRLLGIVWAEAFLVASNILLQSGFAALRIQLTAETELDSLQPISVEKIKNKFTIIGWRSPQILKFFENLENHSDIRLQPEISKPEDTQQITIPQSETEELTETVFVEANLEFEVQELVIIEVANIDTEVSDESLIAEVNDKDEDYLIIETTDIAEEISEEFPTDEVNTVKDSEFADDIEVNYDEAESIVSEISIADEVEILTDEILENSDNVDISEIVDASENVCQMLAISEDPNIVGVLLEEIEFATSSEEIKETEIIAQQPNPLKDNFITQNSSKEEIIFLQKNRKFSSSTSKKKRGFGNSVAVNQKIDQPISIDIKTDLNDQEDIASNITEQPLFSDQQKSEDNLSSTTEPNSLEP